MTRALDGKVALVTGAASGIGQTIALTFARDGARVAVADRDEVGALQTVDAIADHGGEAIFVPVDVAKSADVKAMVTTTTEAYGRLDCAINNAGVGAGPRVALHEFPEERWQEVININLTGVWLCMKHEIAQMFEQGNGAIVNTASVMGLVGAWLPGAIAYNAAKHGVVGMTKTAALEYAAKGIRVNAVCPGYIATPMVDEIFKSVPDIEGPIVARHPIGRLGRPEEGAEAVAWLCSDAASFVTGHAMPVDGGYVAQ